MTVPNLKIAHDDLAAFADRVVNLPKPVADEKRKQVNVLRDRLTTHIAGNPEFSLVKMLHAGSVAKGTALRTVNDFDVAVYVRKQDAPATDTELIEWMAARLREAYGGLIDPSQIVPGTHCVTIAFKGTGTVVDVVPVLYEGDPDDRGYLIAKGTGDRLLTSVRLHLNFIRTRKNNCPDHWAQVVRFVKWWSRNQKSQDGEFKFKSFMIEMICAHLLDTGAVTFDDYPTALEGFFDYVVRTELRERIAFTDFYKKSELPKERVGTIEIFDPVNPTNNVARLYEAAQQKRIVLAAEAALDAITEIGYATTKAQAVQCWQVVFGNRFQG
ncbi:CBASS oligonucleotide cyclase [Micromonospora haikouensis]|uniref:CBASS oligonucleotide cyclase n=1 Tax=Micromonospora haikouensis TaxID=686309 RepID=UPI0037A52AC2